MYSSGRGVEVINPAGTTNLTLNLSSNTFSGPIPGPTQAGGVQLRLKGSTHATLSVTNSTFTNTGGGIDVNAGATSPSATVANVTISGNSFSDTDGISGGGIALSSGGAGAGDTNALTRRRRSGRGSGHS